MTRRADTPPSRPRAEPATKRSVTLQLQEMAKCDPPVGIGVLITVNASVPVDMNAVASAVCNIQKTTGGLESAEILVTEEVQQAGQHSQAGRDLGAGQTAADLTEEGVLVGDQGVDRRGAFAGQPD
jgi:hypothetical protein